MVQNYFAGGVNVNADGISRNGWAWGGYWITPKDAGNNYVNNFPQIISMGLSTKYYADNFPELDFTNKGNESIYGSIYNGEKALTGNEAFINTYSFFYDKSKSFIKLFSNQVKMNKTPIGQNGEYKFILMFSTLLQKIFLAM